MTKRQMNALKKLQCSIVFGCLFFALASSAIGGPLSAGEPVLLEHTQGRFDFLRLDSAHRRLLLAHTGNKTLDVFDLNSGHLLKSISTGAAQDSAIDNKNGRYYVSVSDPPRMVIIDAAKLEVTGEVPLAAPSDLITFNPAKGLVYVCNDEAGELWVIDPSAKKILTTINLPGKGMEDLTFDPQNKRLFQLLKEANLLSIIDPSNNKVLESWPTAPAEKPHGLALVPDTDFLLIAGGNGKLVLINRASGKVLANADIAERVDEIAYDPQLHKVYCASGQGKISVVGLEGDKLNALGDMPDESGCHSIVVDPKTHTVWIAYGKRDQSFIQPFTSAQN
jgi:DNA-binding beta-propeller fold protein YncE